MIRKLEDQFVGVKEIAEVNIRQQPIVLCRYAIRLWHQSGRARGSFAEAIHVANCLLQRAVAVGM